jgi:hypothetical protein
LGRGRCSSRERRGSSSRHGPCEKPSTRGTQVNWAPALHVCSLVAHHVALTQSRTLCSRLYAVDVAICFASGCLSCPRPPTGVGLPDARPGFRPGVACSIYDRLHALYVAFGGICLACCMFSHTSLLPVCALSFLQAACPCPEAGHFAMSLATARSVKV